MVDDERPPSAVGLVWLFIRWAPAVIMVSLLTLWTLVVMGGLARVFGWITIMSIAPSFAFFVSMVVVIYALIRRRVSRPMVVAWVLSLIVMWPGLWSHGFLPMKYPTSIDAMPAAVLRVPSAEAMRVYWGGEDLDENYHALYPDQRFAFDLVIEPAGLKDAPLDAYGCFGKPILAPIDGEVVVMHDGEMEQTPGQVVDVEPAAGNHVVLKLASDTFLYLAHLQKDSVQVKVGDRVVAGQVLARCGNSGRTSEPHLHIHHQREDPREYPFGFAEGLPIFFESHDGPRLPHGGVTEEDGRIRLDGDRIRHLRTSTTALP